MKSLRVIALAQAAFFVAWAGWEEWKVVSVPTVVLETFLVDPRDLLSGQFLALGYSITNIRSVPGFPSNKLAGSPSIGVFLRPSGKRVIGGKTWTIWTATECRIPPPVIPSKQDVAKGVWVVGTLIDGGVVYGIERFYFSEDRIKEMGQLRSGRVLMEASVGRNGKLAVKKLIY